MTDDQQDINKKPKPKPKSIFEKIINIIGLLILSFILSFIMLSILYSPMYRHSSYNGPLEYSSLHQSLQSAAAIYVAQQRVMPEKFSDFVTPNYPMEVLNLDNLDTKLEGIDTTELQVIIPNLNEFAT